MGFRSHQGAPTSPIFSNLYMRLFDQMMLRLVGDYYRYGDDCFYWTKTASEAYDVLAVGTDYLQNHMGLKVNTLPHKTGLFVPDHRLIILGYSYNKFQQLTVARKKVDPFKCKVLIRINEWKQHKDVDLFITDLGILIFAWSNYFKHVEDSDLLMELDMWIIRQVLFAIRYMHKDHASRYSLLRKFTRNRKGANSLAYVLNSRKFSIHSLTYEFTASKVNTDLLLLPSTGIDIAKRIRKKVVA